LKEKKQCTVESLLFLTFVHLDNYLAHICLADKKKQEKKTDFIIDRQQYNTTNDNFTQPTAMLLTHAYVHWLADVHFGSFAPAFTLSFHDSECSRKPPNAHSLGRYRQC